MIRGNITLEDVRISFLQQTDGTINAVILDTFTVEPEVLANLPMDKFFKALAIAVHPEGEAACQEDYEDAESIMGMIRWIP